MSFEPISTDSTGSIDGILAFAGVEIAGVEFTSKCNLSCVYCDVAAEGYVGRNTGPEVLDKAFAFLGENPPRWLNLTGIGEITIMPEWVRAVERFVALAHS